MKIDGFMKKKTYSADSEQYLDVGVGLLMFIIFVVSIFCYLSPEVAESLGPAASEILISSGGFFYDTSMLLHGYVIDDIIQPVIDLYLDAVNIFLELFANNIE